MDMKPLTKRQYMRALRSSGWKPFNHNRELTITELNRIREEIERMRETDRPNYLD